MAINLFQIASEDQSVSYLGQIFGFVGNLLPAKDPNLLVGILFKTLNTMALTIGALLVVYVVVVGLLKTAQEGEFLGKQWNSLWVPIRTVLGIAALFPTTTGYSAIQIVIMWIILQGVGAADTLWTKVIQFVNTAGSPYTAVNSSSLQTTDVQLQMRQLFQGLMCQASARATYSDISTDRGGTGEPIKYYCGQPGNNDRFCTMTDSEMLNPTKGPQVSNNIYNMGPLLGKCGKLTYCDQNASCTAPMIKDPGGSGKMVPDTNPDNIKKAQNSGACLACKAQHSALEAIVPTLGAIASKLVEIDHEYAQFYETPMDVSKAPDWVQNYCSETGITPEQCCRIPLTFISKCATTFPPDKPREAGTTYSDTSSSASTPINAANSATDFYLQYPLAAYLNGADFINAAVGEYSAAMVGALSQRIQNQMDASKLSGWYAAAAKYGWILAGAYYYKLAGENQNNLDAARPYFIADATGDGDFKKRYRTNSAAVGNMLSAMVSSNRQSSPGFVNPLGKSDEIGLALDSSAGALLESWKNSLSNNQCQGGDCTSGQATNPLISIATFGYQMMITAQLLFVVVTTLVAVMTAITTINPMILGTGLTMNPFGEALKALVTLVGPFFVILISALYSIGALLGIYVPLIPYMIFTVGAIGWLIATIEAMVAGPIIALGILSPGGQHDILGRAEPALMQIFNLFLRPSLMVLGMMISMFLSIVVVKLVNSGFLSATSQIISHPGLFEQILFIAAYTSFIVTALNKAFSLIYIIPERILVWLGSGPVSYGEGEALGATKQAVEGAGSATAGGGKEAGGAVKSQVASEGKKERKIKEGKKAGGRATFGRKQKPEG